ncbi:hypothetical protein PRIPAC_73416 [Pristionchus pacificus]|uniref:Uncharacterized protein n=1 Tax=Pristionchus pacificus TaxID=54126 RepID=A0A2A6C9T4_PRIPA|nr:hypothetical protein PRIPAC_73416 [Pristionchus pacificus]|eukprot:PDM74909.1 hypothetical protein PRIPAC_40290 [Pristionchus pacificus]
MIPEDGMIKLLVILFAIAVVNAEIVITEDEFIEMMKQEKENSKLYLNCTTHDIRITINNWLSIYKKLFNAHVEYMMKGCERPKGRRNRKDATDAQFLFNDFHEKLAYITELDDQVKEFKEKLWMDLNHCKYDNAKAMEQYSTLLYSAYKIFIGKLRRKC